MRKQTSKVVTRSSARHAGEQTSSNATPGRCDSSQAKSQSKRGGAIVRKPSESQTAVATTSSPGVASRSRKATPLRIEMRSGEGDEVLDSSARKQLSQRANAEELSKPTGLDEVMKFKSAEDEVAGHGGPKITTTFNPIVED